MRRPTYVTLAAAGLLSFEGRWQAPSTLLTAPQGDRLRSFSTPASVSVVDDGRSIAFASYERLTAEDRDSSADIYVVDRVTGEITLESAGTAGLPIESDCSNPRIDAAGRFLVFETGIHPEPGSTDIIVEIILRDRVERTTRRATVSVTGGQPNGRSYDPAISADGTTIVFSSSATNLVPGADVNGGQLDIYAYHRPTGTTKRISLNDAGVQLPDGLSIMPTVSGDGRYVAFTSTADLAPPVRRTPAGAEPSTRRQLDVFVRDTVLGRTTRMVSRGVAPDGSSSGAAISRDGRFVAFASLATNLVPQDRNRSRDVFLFDRTEGTVTLVSRSVGRRPANGASSTPSISADGAVVAFHSTASDLVCAPPCSGSNEDVNLLSDVFVFERRSGMIARVSGDPAGGWMEESVAPAVDGSGTVVAFSSRHPIDATDAAHDFDLFVRVPAERP